MMIEATKRIKAAEYVKMTQRAVRGDMIIVISMIAKNDQKS